MVCRGQAAQPADPPSPRLIVPGLTILEDQDREEDASTRLLPLFAPHMNHESTGKGVSRGSSETEAGCCARGVAIWPSSGTEETQPSRLLFLENLRGGPPALGGASAIVGN